MIATLTDCYRLDLPLEVVRAQARVAKLVLERGLPPRLLTLCTYLVSTTNLARGGRVYLSRKKVAAMMNVSERTIDRHFDELETNGFLDRQVRERTATGWFYGTCVKWSADIWDTLFLAPGRTRREALAQQRAKRLEAQVQPEQTTTPEKLNNLPHESRQPKPIHRSMPDPAFFDATPSYHPASTPQPATIHATFLADYTAPSSTNTLKESSLINGQPTKTTSENTFAKQPQSGRPAFNIPPAILPWASKLNLQPENISLLMATAKKTDPNRTKTRLQDLLNYVGERLLRGSILGASASKYLYKCLKSGEDYSHARFNAPDAPSRTNSDGVAATALRDHLPEGQIKLVCGSHLMRDGYAVRKVDPVFGLNGPCALLTLEQQAVMARRAGLIEASSSTDSQAVPTVDQPIQITAQPALPASPTIPVTMSVKDFRRTAIRKEFLNMASSEQEPYVPAAMTHLKNKGMASASVCTKVEAGEWLSAPILVSVMVENYAVAKYGPQWAQ